MSTQPVPRTIVTPLVGLVSVQVASQNITRNGLYVYNPSLAATIAISPSDAAAVINGAGSITLGPGIGITLGADLPYLNGLNAIASSGSTPITIWEF